MSMRSPILTLYHYRIASTWTAGWSFTLCPSTSRKRRQNTGSCATVSVAGNFPSQTSLVAIQSLFVQAKSDWRERLQILWVVWDWGKWTTVHDELTFSEECRELKVVDWCVLNQNPDVVLRDTNKTLPYTGHMWSSGGVEIQRIFFCCNTFSILFWFQRWIDSRSSLSPPTKFAPLSDHSSSGAPLRLINILSTKRKLSVSTVAASSRWTAQVFRQVFKWDPSFPWPAMQWHAYKRFFAFLSGNLTPLSLRLQYILNVFKFRSFVTSLSLSIAQKLTPENVLGVSI